MINYRQVHLYDWFDIQKAICDEMGIDESQFRNYHKVVGGDYKDLWHVAMDTVIPDQMHNDTIVRMYPLDIDLPLVYDPSVSCGIQEYIGDKGKWVIPFFEAYERVMLRLIRGAVDDCDSVYVEFSW